MSVTHQAATLVEYVPETAAKISETKRLSMKMVSFKTVNFSDILNDNILF